MPVPRSEPVVESSMMMIFHGSVLLMIGLLVITAPIGATPGSPDIQKILNSSGSTAYAKLVAMQAAADAWTVPQRPDLVRVATNVQTHGLRGEGATDETASLQSLIDSLPAGAVLYFPAGTYRLEGPIRISRPITLFGEPGAILSCKNDRNGIFFIINEQGSVSSVLKNITITSLEFRGPGVGTDPILMRGFYLQDLRISYVKFSDIGREAIELRSCTDVLIEDCMFDNIYFSGEGYGVAICDRSDRVVVRDCFFVTRGRHGVMTGTSDPDLPFEDYVRQVTVQNNYFENMDSHAIDAHEYMIGPYVIDGNVIFNSNNGIAIGSGESLITNNVIIDCDHGMDIRDPVNSASNRQDLVRGNTLINIDGEYAFYVLNSNAEISGNVASGDGEAYAVLVGPYSPYNCTIEGNVFDNFRAVGIARMRGDATIRSGNNFIKLGYAYTEF